MEIVEHGLWAAAGALAANRKWRAGVGLKWTVWWAVFPDVFAFGPMVILGIVYALWNGGGRVDHHALRLPFDLHPYDVSHSLLVFALVYGLAAWRMNRRAWPLLGWLSHILIDIPTHSYSYYATKFLWPASDFRVDGIPWWTPWFWALTYAALACVYAAMWRAGWMRRGAR